MPCEAEPITASDAEKASRAFILIAGTPDYSNESFRVSTEKP
jgi:hypothetical protein